MSNIDKQEILIIIASILITLLFIICIKCYYRSKSNEFNQISKSINERTRLI
jgi:hypothetical protein